MSSSATPSPAVVIAYLRGLHDRITSGLEQADGGATFRRDSWQRPEGGGGESRVLRDGAVFEQAGINFSHVMGGKLPASATAQRPELAGASFEVVEPEHAGHPHADQAAADRMALRLSLGDVERIGQRGHDLRKPHGGVTLRRRTLGSEDGHRRAAWEGRILRHASR